jgi:hypothetical protein
LTVIEQTSFELRLRQEREALEAVLASSAFARAPRLSALLTYICERYFQGETDSIKEYTLATEVLGRPANFDQARDAIVRVEAHRLRRKLAEYYEAEGKSQRVRIRIERGHYVPEFFIEGVPLEDEPSKESPGPLAESDQKDWSGDTAVKRADDWRKSRWTWLAAGLLGLLVMGGLLTRIAPIQKLWGMAQAGMGLHSSKLSLDPGGLARTSEIRLLCGYLKQDYTDPYGKLWSRDRYFKGGSPGQPSQVYLWRTNNSRLFRNTRTGNFRYDIPLRPGTYEMTLYFAETEMGAGPAESRGGEGGGGEGERAFDIFLNDRPLLKAFDILSDADGPYVADRRVFKDVHPASDGYVHLRFASLVGHAELSAIRLVPGIPHRLRPIRFVTQELPYTDGAGKVWKADDYYRGGHRTYHMKPVGGTSDMGLFASERFGHFSYAIPVDMGSYTVNLYLAETFFGPDNLGGGGIGRRVFNVFCNGNTLLRNFDMLSESEENRAMVRSFRGLQPNAQGKIDLTFEPVVNYADVYAIEVLDEGE